MNSINLIGPLTREPEYDQTAGGSSACRIHLAVPRRKTDGRDQGAVFVTVLAYGGQATAASQYLSKGRQLAVSGRLEYRGVDRPGGIPHSGHKVMSEQLQFLAQPSDLDVSPEGPTAPEPEATVSGQEVGG